MHSALNTKVSLLELLTSKLWGLKDSRGSGEGSGVTGRFRCKFHRFPQQVLKDVLEEQVVDRVQDQPGQVPEQFPQHFADMLHRHCYSAVLKPARQP